MVFGNKYDSSLWYILRVKNVYRNKINGFIKELPEQFIENIQTYNEQIENNSFSQERDYDFFNIPSDVDPSIYYRFYYMCHDLYMIKIQNINGVERQLFSLILQPLDLENVEAKDKPLKKSLGTVGIGQYPEMNFKEVDYSLEQTRFGMMIKHSYIYLANMLELNFYKPTNIDENEVELNREVPYQRKLVKKNE